MIYRLLKGIFKFYLGLMITSFIFSRITRNPQILDFFITNRYAVHIYAISSFILCGLIAIDYKNIKNDAKQIYHKCNEFDKKIIARFSKRPVE